MKKKHSEPTEAGQLSEVVDRLDKLLLVVALQGREKNEQVKYLVSLNYSNSEIGRILAIPKGTIDSIRANLKKGADKNERQTA